MAGRHRFTGGLPRIAGRSGAEQVTAGRSGADQATGGRSGAEHVIAGRSGDGQATGGRGTARGRRETSPRRGAAA